MMKLYKKFVEPHVNSQITDFVRKTYYPTPSFFSGYPGTVQSDEQAQTQGYFQPTDITFLRFYQTVDAVGDAIDRISGKVSEIEPLLENNKNDDFMRNNEILDLLKKPSTNILYSEFMTQATNYFLITGNLYIILSRASSGKQIYEMFVAPSQAITIRMDNEGYPQSYHYTAQYTYWTFEKQIINGDLRYLTQDNTHELIHLKDFNPNESTHKIKGTSKLQSVLRQVLQLEAGAIHNLALLKNGAKPSVLFKLKDDLTIDQREQLRSDITKIYQGEYNAGRSIASNDIEDIVNYMVNNLDMDYMNLKKSAEESIYKKFNVPLVLINTDATTLNNYQTALLAFYDDAIIPTYKKIMNFLSFYLGFYDNTLLKYTLSFDPLTIPAMRERRISELNNMYKLQVMSDNEIRNRLGLEDYPQGNEIWKLTTMAPVSMTEDLPDGARLGDNSGQQNDDDENNNNQNDKNNNQNDQNNNQEDKENG